MILCSRGVHRFRNRCFGSGRELNRWIKPGDVVEFKWRDRHPEEQGGTIWVKEDAMKKEACFWVLFGNKFIHIRYVAFCNGGQGLGR